MAEMSLNPTRILNSMGLVRQERIGGTCAGGWMGELSKLNLLVPIGYTLAVTPNCEPGASSGKGCAIKGAGLSLCFSF